MKSIELTALFKKQPNGTSVLKLISEIGRRPEVECMNLRSFSKSTGDSPVYAFVSEKEVVLLMLDWCTTPIEEIADEEGVLGEPPLYFGRNSRRVSPAWQLSEFSRHYKQAMADASVQVGTIWNVLMTNSTLINYDDMLPAWELMSTTVYHGFGNSPVPYVYYSNQYHKIALAQYKAFRIWCEQQGFLFRDPFAFEGIDADYEEMEYGLSDDDDIMDDDDTFDLGEYFGDDEDTSDDEPDIDLSQFPSGAVHLSQKKVVNVEILKPMPAPREELEKLVGCQNIKSQICDLIELTKYNKWMSSHYPTWKQHQISLHAIFLGRPGTGKTTVCKIYGGLLKEAGVLTRGHVVVCNRATFIGSNWGDEENAIHQVLKKAKGGVLMIDEAYLLNSSHPNDPGKLILPQFMDILSNEQQRDIAIVLCGYKEPMQKLLDLNPGLASRFSHRFEFKDFSIDELMKITFHRLNEYGYHFTRAGLHKYKKVLAEAYSVRNPNNWGNARFVANLLENIYLAHAKRCMRSKSSHRPEAFFSITSSDIQPIEVQTAKKRVGF